MRTMNSLVAGILAGLAVFFAVRLSRTFFFENGTLQTIREIDTSSIPPKVDVNLNVIEPSIPTSTDPRENPFLNPDNFA